MPITTYTSGEVLTASSLNANFAAAGGLQLVKSQTIGSAVGSVTVTGAFSSTYDNYKIIISGGVGSADSSLAITLGSTVTNYCRFIFFGAFNSNTIAGSATNTGVTWDAVGQVSVNSMSLDMELQSPFLSKRTHFYARATQSTTTGNIYLNNGFLNDSTSYTAFTVTNASGTLTGGTIRVYGYTNS